MLDAFIAVNGFEIFFLICAMMGSFFVLVLMVLQCVGGDSNTDGDLDAEHPDADVGFKVLSMHSLTVFLMMFGLVGLALYRRGGNGFIGSISGACPAGVASVLVVDRLFKFFSRA